MMNKIWGGLGVGAILVWIAIIVAAVYGWIENIVSIIHVIHDPVTTMTVLRAVGIFVFPLGAVLGYF